MRKKRKNDVAPSTSTGNNENGDMKSDFKPVRTFLSDPRIELQSKPVPKRKSGPKSKTGSSLGDSTGYFLTRLLKTEFVFL